jgi:hypothetical protein
MYDSDHYKQKNWGDFPPKDWTPSSPMISGEPLAYEDRLRRAGKILHVPTAARPRQCEHVKSNGEFCGSPALRGRNYCYFHLTLIGRRLRAERHYERAQATSQATSDNAVVRLDLPPLEDPNSIQVALMQVVDALLANRIDSKRAGLVLYALQTASSNLAHGANFAPANATTVASRYDDFEQDFELGDEVPELRQDEAEDAKLDQQHDTAAHEQQVLEACAKLETVQKEAEETERMAAMDDDFDFFQCHPHLRFLCSIKGPLACATAPDETQQQQWEREAGSQRLTMQRRAAANPPPAPAPERAAEQASVVEEKTLAA